MNLLAQERSLYNELSVYETTELFGQLGKFRVLQFADQAIQGAMDLKEPACIVLEYQKAIVHLLEHNHPLFHSVFIIGHGIGTIAGRYPDKRVCVAEIDERIVELSQRFFGYKRPNVAIGDGRHLLEREASNTYDAIILDAFTAKGTPPHLTSLSFFELTKEKLHPSGFILMNAMGKLRNDKRLSAIHSTMSEVYPYTKVFCQPGVDASDACNLILMGGHEEIAYQIRDMGAFTEIELAPGFIIQDKE